MTDVTAFRTSVAEPLRDEVRDHYTEQHARSAGSPRTGSAAFAPTVQDVLATRPLHRARLLAGTTGIARRVLRLPTLAPQALDSANPYDLAVVPGPLARSDSEDLLARLAGNDVAGLVLTVGPGGVAGSRRLLSWADQLGLPLIVVPDRDGTDLEGRILADLLDRRGAALAWAERVHRGFEHIVRVAGGLQDVADELVRLLGAAVFVTTADGTVLVSSGAPRLLSAGRTTTLFDPLGRCLAALQPPGVHTRADGGGSHAVVAVVIGLEDEARIVAVRELGGFAHEEMQALERAATVVALGLARRRVAAEAEARHQSETLRELLDGRLSPDHACDAAAEFGWDLTRPLAVVASQLDPPEPAAAGANGVDPEQARSQRESFAAAWSVAVRARDAKAAVARIGTQVVCLVAAGGSGHRLVRAAAAAVESKQPDSVFTTGISRGVAGLAQLPEAYEQAQRAVSVGRQVHGPGSVTEFDALGVYRLLSLVREGSELSGFARETLGELATRDDAETRDLRQTLEILLETNLNVAETARRQHFHYNTLRYRIAKLERMLGPFTDDAHLRLNLMLALQVVRMRGADSG
jgi:purine catabolism regulator